MIVRPVERIRGPNLAVFVKPAVRTSDIVPFERAFEQANRGNRVIASHARVITAVNDEDFLDSFGGARFRTGTIFGYLEPNTPLNDKHLSVITDVDIERAAGTRYFISYFDPNTNQELLLPVHPKYLGNTNVVLVSEHPDYGLVPDGRRTFVMPAAGKTLDEAVDLVRDFPLKSDFCAGDPKHMVPISSADVRPSLYLIRTRRFVGPSVILAVHSTYPQVDLSVPPSAPDCGLLVESADANVAKATVPSSPVQEGHLCGILKGYTPSGTD